MSDKFFFNKFTSSFTDILDQIQNENYPAEVLENGKIVSEKWSCKDFLNYFVQLYYKYVKLLAKIEEAYDQTVHPQLRVHVKKFLENILCRLVQVKKEILFYNNPIIELPGIPYFFMDDYIIDMKIEPRDLDLIIPQYFREDDSQLTKERMAIIDQRLIQKYGSAIPEEDFFPSQSENFSLDFEKAVRILQNFEMGRQAVQRIDKQDNKKKTSIEGGKEEIKKIIMENLIARYKLKKVKFDDLELIKMIPQDLELLDEEDYIKFAKKNREERKKIQADNLELYNIQKEELKTKFQKIEEDDIREDMKNQRRDWISEQIKFNDPKTQGPPYDVNQFYLRNNVEKKVVLDENQLKMKETIAKDKLKQKQDDKKKNEQGQMIKCKF